MAQPVEPTVKLNIPSANRPAPIAANWFHFSRVNAEFQLLVGYIDAAVVHEAVQQTKNGRNATVDVEVTHRIAMSIGSLKMLRDSIQEIVGSEESAEVASR